MQSGRSLARRYVGSLLASAWVCGMTIWTARAGAEPTQAEADSAAGIASAEVGGKSTNSKCGGRFEDRWTRVREAGQIQRKSESRQRRAILDGYGAVQNELDRAFRGGNLPDVAIVEIHHIVSFAADDRIQPLDEFMKNDPTFQADDLLPGILTNLRYRDKLYAIPMNRSMPMLYYNKDRFAAAGLDPNKPPATWQEVREMSSSI